MTMELNQEELTKVIKEITRLKKELEDYSDYSEDK